MGQKTQGMYQGNIKKMGGVTRATTIIKPVDIFLHDKLDWGIDLPLQGQFRLSLECQSISKIE